MPRAARVSSGQLVGPRRAEGQVTRSKSLPKSSHRHPDKEEVGGFTSSQAQLLAWITRHLRTVEASERLPSHHETYVYWAIIIVLTRRLARKPGPTVADTVRTSELSHSASHG